MNRRTAPRTETTKHPVFESLRRSADACVCTVMRKASRSATQMYDRFLEPSGMTIAQFSVLAALYYTRSIPMMKLAKRLVMDRTTLTRNLSPLERRHLVRVVSDPDDARVRRVVLTAEGLEALVAALPFWQRAQEEMLAGVSESLWRELRAGLLLAVDVAKGSVERPV